MLRMLLFAGFVAASAFAARPNVLLIVTDDQGYGDLSIHGNEVLETPNLDRLAEQSARFDNFHAAPCCAPTRASLLTGRNHHETGVWGVHWARDYLALDETTIADVLRDAGYDTGMIGKWHSGRAGAWLPWNRGFDDAWVAELYRHENPRISHNGKKMETQGHADALLTDIAVDFIGQDRGERPYFLLMSYLSPHGPWVSPEAYAEEYRGKGCSDRFAELNGMMEHMDHQIGRLLASVDAENTLVLFMSDNGPTYKNDNDGSLSEDEKALRNPAELRGQKGNIWENATRVPLFARWPGRVEPRRVDALADVTDLFPTLLELTGARAEKTAGPIHGRSLAPLLKGADEWAEPRELFKPYWNPFRDESWSNNGALNVADVAYDNQINAYYAEPYKLVQYRGKPFALFDLRNDPGETADLAAKHPEKTRALAKKMKAEYEAMRATGRCFPQPRFHIGHPEYDASEAVGEVLSGSMIPFCSSVRDEGNVVCQSHHSNGWKAAGDAQTIQVEVATPGIYEVFLEAQRFHPGAKARLEVGESRLDFSLPRAKGEIKVGEIELKAGPRDLRLVLTSVPEGEGDAIERMKMARFAKK